MKVFIKLANNELKEQPRADLVYQNPGTAHNETRK